MKHKLFFAFFISLVLLVTGCSFNQSDSKKFKNEYESLNGTKVEGKSVRNINIDKNNPFIYSSAEEVAKKIENKETFAVYFGFKECPWCRSVIESLIEVSSDLGLEEIYYVDVKNIRDTMKVNDDGKVETAKKGTSGYYKLLKLLDNVLDDYTLTNKDNEGVSANEKAARIAPPCRPCHGALPAGRVRGTACRTRTGNNPPYRNQSPAHRGPQPNPHPDPCPTARFTAGVRQLRAAGMAQRAVQHLSAGRRQPLDRGSPGPDAAEPCRGGGLDHPAGADL